MSCFFFLPAVPIQPGNIEYFDTEQDTKVTANNADVSLLKDVEYPNEIRVPLAWWLVHEISSFATKVIVGIIDSLGDPTTLRPILMRVADMKLLEPSLVKEIQNFRSDCYEPALAKFQGLENTPQIPNQFHDVDWIGSRMFVQTPGFYKKCTNIESCGTGYHARKYQQSWAGLDANQSFGSGRPFCDVWWTNSQIGLRTKILNSLSDEHPWLRDAIDKMRSNADEDDSANHGTSVADYEDRILRRVTTTGPWAMVERADRGKNIKWFSKEIFSINGIQQILASIGNIDSFGTVFNFDGVHCYWIADGAGISINDVLHCDSASGSLRGCCPINHFASGIDSVFASFRNCTLGTRKVPGRKTAGDHVSQFSCTGIRR